MPMLIARGCTAVGQPVLSDIFINAVQGNGSASVAAAELSGS